LAPVGYLQIRASATDQDRTIDVLKAAFVEGRLTKLELDQRVGQALSERYFADLIALIDDVPAGVFARLPAHRPSPAFPPASRLGQAILPIATTFLALGIYDGSLLISVPSGVVTPTSRRRTRSGVRWLAEARAAPRSFSSRPPSLSLGIYADSLLLAVPFGVMTLLAAGALVQAVRTARRRVALNAGPLLLRAGCSAEPVSRRTQP
jgi:Domain of unknown function (DUF1707)